MHCHLPRTNRFLHATLVTGFVAATTPAWGQVINEDLKLLASDGSGEDRFGFAIAIDSGVVAVGARYDNDNGTNSGSAYLFDASTGIQIAKLLPSDGASGERFGHSIALDNGVVVVGAYLDDDNGTYSGSVYLFDASIGVQIAKILPSDGWQNDQFGHSVAIDNGIVVVGAPGDDDSGGGSGSAYLFDASTGVEIAKLLATDGGEGDLFGYSVAIESGAVAVGAVWADPNGSKSGSAYVFDASTGAQVSKLLPSDGWSQDHFGWCIAIDDGIVAVGAVYDGDNGDESGSAYLFDANTAAQIAKLLPNSGHSNGVFGRAIAIDNGVVVVGSGLGNSAHLFDSTTGIQIAKLKPSDGVGLDFFGGSVAIDDSVVAVGAKGDDDNGSDSGSAYVLDIRCPVDVNRDGVISTLDFLTYLNAWAGREPLADWDDTYTINTLDFLAYLNDWAAGCP